MPGKYDYVIAGGGSAGCTLAARLAEDPSIKVCLVEAGGNGRNACREQGYYIGPTIFANVPYDADLAQNEVFGPVVSTES